MVEIRTGRARPKDALSLALDQARASLGSESDAQRIWKGLQGRIGELGAPVPELPATPISSPTSGLLGVAKSWLTLCAVGAVLGGAAWALWPSDATRPPPMAMPTPVAQPRQVRGVPFHSAARALPAPSKAAGELARVEESDPVSTAPRRARRTPVAPAVTGDRVDPAAEITLVEEAQRSLERSPRQALLPLSQHAARFPRGVLAEEREVMWIEALVQLGRTQDALARADGFLASFPSSPHRRRVETLVSRNAAGDHKTGAEPVLTD